jgi:hypothetical protein
VRLPPGEVGTLCLRHRRLAKPFEYHLACAKTGEAYIEGGAFAIGDIGRVDADGYVYLADRKSHTIISGGVNIYPAEVEEVLQRHPAVADVAVFGIPDEEWGEVGVARFGGGLDRLRAHSPCGLQGAALDRFRSATAAPSDREAVHAFVAGAVLERARAKHLTWVTRASRSG